MSTTETKIVLVKSKSSSHVYFGQGSSKGYFIDGIESPSLTLEQNITYIFNQSDSSNINHRIQFFADANKTIPYQTNVNEVGIAGFEGAYTEITISDRSPLEIFYQCQNHAYMGNRVNWSGAINQSPTEITLSTTSFNENVFSNSTIATLESTDTNSSDSHTYTLVSGDGDDDNLYFSISDNSLKINITPDYESKNLYKIRLQTEDESGATFTKALSINVNNLKEYISLDNAYQSKNLAKTYDLGPFDRSIDVYGLKVVGLKNTGGNVAVGDEFLKKVSQTVKLLLNPQGENIDAASQLKAINHMKNINTIQRIGVEGMNTYSPTLNGNNYVGWDATNDKHSLTDFIWQYNLSGSSEQTANSQITEVLEHLLHTLVRFALPGAFPEQFLFIEDRSPEYGGEASKEEPILSGLLYEASKEAINNGVFDPSSYNSLGINSFNYWKSVMVEYQYALTFAEWGFIPTYAGSLDPEWSDNYLTPEKIQEGNPLGHNLYENYIKKIINKPSTTDLDNIFQANNQGLSGYIVNVGTNGNDLLDGANSIDTFFASEGLDTIDGKGDEDLIIYRGKYSEYLFQRSTDTLQIADQRTIGTTDGTDTLKNIEYIQFSDQTIEESKVDVVKTYSDDFANYKFYNRGNGKYEIKTDSGFDDITGIPKLVFPDKARSAIVDIKGTFDQVTGLNTPSGEMFRLYNAAFKRLPDPDGLKYWIYNYSSGINDERAVAQSFLVSAEFKQRYGENVSNAKYVETLYTNVLGRNYDQEGYNYWLGNLNNGTETRYELLLGFSESTENKALFTEMTGFS